MTTIKDIAERLGVSVSTVSKGLNGASDISEHLRQLVLDTAVEMGYTTRQMRTRSNKKLCLFMENMAYETPEDFGYDIVLGFRQSAYKENYDVTILPVSPSFQETEKYDTYMLQNDFVGSFFIGFELDDPWMLQLPHTTVPTTLLDNYIKKNPTVCCVGTDSVEGIDDAVNHLVRLGHKQIAFLNGAAHSMISEERLLAFKESMLVNHLPAPDSMTPYGGSYEAACAGKHIDSLLSQGTTAILCGNDLIASGVIAECKRRGLSVPKDISVIGIDDVPLAEKLDPPLTTIRQDRLELGKAGFYTLHSLINNVSICKNLLRPQFVVRKSTAPVKNRH